MRRFDAIVVGGGPAGSSCARRLRQGGLAVALLDRAAFPRDKPCAGWVTPGALQALAIAPEEYAEGRTLQPFAGFRVGRIGGPEVEGDEGRPVSFGIRRLELDQFLVERSGAELRTGEPVTALRRAGSEWIVNEELTAPLLIGAAGTLCPVARALNGTRSAATPVVAQVIELRLDARQRAACAVVPEVPEIYFSRDLRGYGWCMRKGDYLNVGLGRHDPRGLAAHVRAFVAWAVRRGRIPDTLPGEWRGYSYLLRERPPRRIVGDGALLVGDAAGLASPESGEGIRPAIESGLIAAQTVLAARGRRREDLAGYEAALYARLGPRRRRFALPGALAGLVGGRLLGARWFVHGVVLDRWFLDVGRPPLSARACGPPGRRAAA